jgi:hypothetical protein
MAKLISSFCLPPACLLAFAELISLTLKMEAICFSETSVETQRSTRRNIPEDDDTLLSNKLKFAVLVLNAPKNMATCQNITLVTE